MGNSSTSLSSLPPRSASSSPSSGSSSRVMSQDSLAGRGRILLDMFDKARNDQKVKSLGKDEAQTIAFCQDVLRVDAPEWDARYEIERTISCGTTSVVVYARDSYATLEHKAHVAIKVCLFFVCFEKHVPLSHA